jgi:hypothetical protein
MKPADSRHFRVWTLRAMPTPPHRNQQKRAIDVW